MRFFNDDLTEEIDPDDIEINDEGGVATMEEGEELEPSVEDAITAVIVEGMLDGRIPCDDDAFEEAKEIGLSLGIVVNTKEGLALARDCVDANGLELASVGYGAKYAANFGKAFGGAKRVSMGARLGGAADAAGRAIGRAVGRGGKKLGNAMRMRGNIGPGNDVKNAAKAFGNYAHKNPRKTLAGAAAGGAFGAAVGARVVQRASGGNQNPSPLVANAEMRRTNAKK